MKASPISRSGWKLFFPAQESALPESGRHGGEGRRGWRAEVLKFCGDLKSGLKPQGEVCSHPEGVVVVARSR